MKILRFLKSWLTDGCIYYTVISALFLLISLAMGNTADTAIRSSSFALMIPCGLVISLGTQILRSRIIPRWGRYLLHFLFTVLGIFLFLWLPANTASSSITPMAGFLMLVLFSVLYWLIFLLCLLIRNRYRKLMKED